jgi:probable addiction module antidote protein
MAKASRVAAVENLKNATLLAEYLTLAFEIGSAKGIVKAVNAVARAKGMSDLARETGLDRASLYKSLKKGDLKLSTTMKLLDCFNMQLIVVPRKKVAA